MEVRTNDCGECLVEGEGRVKNGSECCRFSASGSLGASNLYKHSVPFFLGVYVFVINCGAFFVFIFFSYSLFMSPRREEEGGGEGAPLGEFCAFPFSEIFIVC